MKQIKNKYFRAVEKVAKEWKLECSKHAPHFWMNPHSQKRYITFYHKVLFLVYLPNGKVNIEAMCDMTFREFNRLHNQMSKFKRRVNQEIRKEGVFPKHNIRKIQSPITCPSCKKGILGKKRLHKVKMNID